MANQILVVEDDAKTLKVLVQTLEDEDYQVVGVTDVEQALDVSRKFQFELLITDVRLPKKVDGVDGFAKLKRRNPGLKCIVVTGYADSDAAFRAIKNRVDDWIVKPLDLDDLLDTVDRVLNPESVAQKISGLFSKLSGKALKSAAELFRIDAGSSLKKARKQAFTSLFTAITSGSINARTANFFYSSLYANDITYLKYLAESDVEGSRELVKEYDRLQNLIEATANTKGQSLKKGDLPPDEFRVLYDAVNKRKITTNQFEISATLRSHTEAELKASPELLELRRTMWGKAA